MDDHTRFIAVVVFVFAVAMLLLEQREVIAKLAASIGLL